MRLDKDAYLYGLLHANDILEAFGSEGRRALEREIKARTGGMKLPANIDLCMLTEMARKQVEPELQCVSVAMAWALEKGLKLPSTRIAKFLEVFNDKIDVYRAEPEQMHMDERILDQSWGGASAAGQKWFEMYEERMEKARAAEKEVEGDE